MTGDWPSRLSFECRLAEQFRSLMMFACLVAYYSSLSTNIRFPGLRAKDKKMWKMKRLRDDFDIR